MKMRLRQLVCLFFALGIFGVAQAQVNWPEDPEKRAIAEEKYVLTGDYTKQDNYEEAVKSFRWLFNETPDLTEGIYIYGIQIYRGLSAKAKDPAMEKAYGDTLMMVYDKRIELYNDEAKQTDRQAFDAYRAFKDHEDRYQQTLELFEKTFELNGNKVSANNLVTYLDIARRTKIKKPELVDDEKILDIYGQCMQVLEAQKDVYKKKGRPTGKFDKVEDQLNKLLVASINVDCDFIEKNMAPKLAEKPDDLKLAKNIFRLSLAGKCSDNPSYLAAAKVIQEQEPSYGLAKFIAIKALGNKEMDESLTYFQQAVDLADNETDKGEAFLNMAKIYQAKGDKSSARNYARKAVSADPNQRTDAYSLIGNLYMGSFEACKQGENPVKDRGVYLAAYEMFKRAGNTKMMKVAQEQFPSMEEIFTYNMKVGDKFTVGCWINEEVTIQKR